MKILFFNPSRAGLGNIPINIPVLISILVEHKHTVKLFDLSDYDIFNNKEYESIFFKEAKMDESKVIQDRKNFYKGAFEKAVHGTDLKKSDYTKDFEELLNTFKPDMIAVSSLSVDFKFACDFLRPFVKKNKIPVIFGGIHVILLPEESMSDEVCSMVCVGEGETAFPKLLEAIENKQSLETIEGIWFKDENGKIIKNPFTLLTDLTTLPILNLDLFDPIHFYRPFAGKRYKMLNFEMSRGCPFNCTYCVNGVLKGLYKTHGPYHRMKSVDQGINELKELIKKYHFDFIRFWDEDFTANPLNYLREYGEKYIAEINLPFIIYSRVDTITDEKLDILYRMGCKGLSVGIESGNEWIRKNVMNRFMSNALIIEKFALCKKHKIRVSAYNMMGLPFDTRETIFDTIELNRTVEPDSFSVTLLEPYKGTPIRKMCEDQGLPPDHETQYTPLKPQFVPKDMTSDELAGLFRTFPLYIKFPKDRYPEIKLAETDDEAYKKLMKEFENIK